MPNVEEAIRRREVELAIEKREKQLKMSKRTTKGVTAEKVGIGVGDVALGLPSSVGGFLFDTVPSYVAAGAQGLVGSKGDPGMLFGGDFGFRRRLENQQEDKTLLQKGFGNIPRPEVSDVAGVVGAIKQNPSTGRDFGEAFREDKMAFEQEQMDLSEAFPAAETMGDIGTDIASLILLRQPLAKNIRASELRLMGITPTIGKGVWQDAITKPWMRKLLRGIGRSAETGAEAMALDILKGDDPLQTAAYAAGGQMAGSVALSAMKGVFVGRDIGHVGLKIAGAALAAGSLWQVIEDVVPGGRQSIISSIETGYDKVVLAMILGLGAGLTGGGRMRGENILANNYPKIADALASVPRGLTLSVLEELMNDPEQPPEEAVNKVLETKDEFRNWLEADDRDD